jgi:hypothetical protein
LNESSLLDLDGEGAVVDDLHHEHAETCVRCGVPVFLEASERYSVVFLRVSELPMKVERRAPTNSSLE